MEESELERAKAYLKDLEKYKKPKMNLGTYNLGDGKWHIVNRTCYEHMRACVRFLEFLEEYRESMTLDVNNKIDMKLLKERDINLKEKTTDLRNTIKLYANKGIK